MIKSDVQCNKFKFDVKKCVLGSPSVLQSTPAPAQFKEANFIWKNPNTPIHDYYRFGYAKPELKLKKCVNWHDGVHQKHKISCSEQELHSATLIFWKKRKRRNFLPFSLFIEVNSNRLLKNFIVQRERKRSQKQDSQTGKKEGKGMEKYHKRMAVNALPRRTTFAEKPQKLGTDKKCCREQLRMHFPGTCINVLIARIL